MILISYQQYRIRLDTLEAQLRQKWKPSSTPLLGREIQSAGIPSRLFLATLNMKWV
jgi:hypothetical protein